MLKLENLADQLKGIQNSQPDHREILAKTAGESEKKSLQYRVTLILMTAHAKYAHFQEGVEAENLFSKTLV